MTRIVATYSQNGEWLNINTAFVSGAMNIIEPYVSDQMTALPAESEPVFDGRNVINLDETTGWQQNITASGDFTIQAPTLPETPDRFPLHDWQLTLEGLPRIYHRLQRSTIAAIFGEVTVDMIDRVYAETRPDHESVGDLLATYRSQGTQDFASVQKQVAQMPTVVHGITQNINEITHEGRRTFVDQAHCLDRVYSGRLVIAKEVIIGPL